MQGEAEKEGSALCSPGIGEPAVALITGSEPLTGAPGSFLSLPSYP